MMKNYFLTFLFFGLINQVFCQITLKVLDKTNSNKKIFAAGNFNNWNPADEGFSLTSINGFHFLTFYPKTKVEFKFTQGNWNTAEGDSLGNQINNRLIAEINQKDTINLIIEGWETSIPKVSTMAQNVIWVETFAKDESLEFNPEIWVYLPKSYHEKSDTYYPVIYLMDGENLFDQTIAYSEEWGIDETLNEKELEIIVVGIGNCKSQRMDIYAPWSNSEYGGGKGVDFTKLFIYKIKPELEKQFRIDKSRKQNFIGGSSLGALIGQYILMKYPKSFGGVINFSPAFWFNPEIYDFTIDSEFDGLTKFYFASGGAESEVIKSGQQKMVEILNKKTEAIVNYKILPGESHNESFWKKDFFTAITWLLN